MNVGDARKMEEICVEHSYDKNMYKMKTYPNQMIFGCLFTVYYCY